MKEGLEFVYDGINSEDMGLYNVSVQEGMYEEPFLSQRDIKEVKVRGRDMPYFQGVERSPLVLKLTFAFQDTWDKEKIRAVARWLNQDYYKPFYTTDNLDRVFYCILQSSPTLLHTGLEEGYIELEFRCDSPYSYSPKYESKEYDVTSTSRLGDIVETTDTDWNNGYLVGASVDTGDLVVRTVSWDALRSRKWGDL